MKNKNILTKILALLLTIILIVMIFFLIDYINAKKYKNELIKKQENYREQINNINNNNAEINTEIDKLKEETKSKVEEYDIWLETKEKLEKAIS